MKKKFEKITKEPLYQVMMHRYECASHTDFYVISTGQPFFRPVGTCWDDTWGHGHSAGLGIQKYASQIPVKMDVVLGGPYARMGFDMSKKNLMKLMRQEMAEDRYKVEEYKTLFEMVSSAEFDGDHSILGGCYTFDYLRVDNLGVDIRLCAPEGMDHVLLRIHHGELAVSLTLAVINRESSSSRIDTVTLDIGGKDFGWKVCVQEHSFGRPLRPMRRLIFREESVGEEDRRRYVCDVEEIRTL